MKKTFTLLMLLAACVFTASAQTKSNGGFKLNIGLDGLLPVGETKVGYDYGVGLSVKGEIPVSQAFKVTASVGFNTLMFSSLSTEAHKVNGDNEQSATFVPVEVGARYYIKSRYYVEGQIGAAIGTQTGTSSSAGITPDSGTNFAYTPGAGILFPMKGGEAIDIGVRYEGWVRDGSTLAFLGLRVAYKFAF